MPGRFFMEEHSTWRKEKALLSLNKFSQNSLVLVWWAARQYTVEWAAIKINVQNYSKARMGHIYWAKLGKLIEEIIASELVKKVRCK